MQTVPSEFICQLRPLMFVAGLGTDQQDLDTSASPASSSQVQSFQQLSQNLRQVFISGRGYPVYDALSAKRKADFNVLLVEKNVRFPPRKARLQNGQGGAHSPISPFTPTSPLYPDGLIAPIWIRKHRELIPSVFVLVLRLYEFGAPSEDGTPDLAELETGPLERERVERLRDNELVNEVMNRKRTCNERGIKLAVVLLASREMLDDPALDIRLSHIRRLSGLDSRASLFVLSPVPIKEVQNFVSSLQNELLETSIDYYREHGRRLRRKRARPANSNMAVSINSPAQGEKNGTGSPHVTLNNAALNVRYEFKAATFAEFRAEIEVALKHYEDCYSTLLDLFTNPVSATNTHPFILARTKRWAEARVLADCLIVKISKMYLYSGNAEYAVLTHHHHVRRMSHISASKWGMDQTSFEYWSWESKQHRIFGDLIEAAMGAGFKIPLVPGPMPGPPLQAKASAQHVPAQVLQHPGAYYLRAGLAAEVRRKLFLVALQHYEAAYSQAMTDPNIDEPPKMSAALAHEKSAPHADQIIELYTKAYDHYKGSRGVRMTLSLAYSIARVHHNNGALDTALRFDERISKTYRRERWLSVLDSILARDASALSSQPQDATTSRPTGIDDGGSREQQAELRSDHASLLRDSFKICMERLVILSQQDKGIKRADVTATSVLQSLVSWATKPLDSISTSPVELSSVDLPLPFAFKASFWRPCATLGEAIPYQICFQSSLLLDSAVDFVNITSMEIHYSDERPPVVVSHDEQAPTHGVVNLVDGVATTAQLKWLLAEGVVMGTLSSAFVQTVSIVKVVIHLEVARHALVLHLHDSAANATSSDVSKWRLPSEALPRSNKIIRHLSQGSTRLASSCSFEPRKIRLHFETTADYPAYLDETFPITLNIKNEDTLSVSVYLDALLNPLLHPDIPSSDTVGDYIQLEGTTGKTSSLSNVLLIETLSPGESLAKDLYISTFLLPGERSLDMSVVVKPAPSTEEGVQVAVTEVSKQLGINVVHPVFCDFQPVWYRPKRESESPKHPSILDLNLPDTDDLAHRLSLEVTLGAFGPTTLIIHNIILSLSSDTGSVKLIKDSVEEDGVLSEPWEPLDPYCVVFDLLVSRGANASEQQTLEIVWSRSKTSPKFTTHIPLPRLLPPPSSISPQILACHPSSAILHRPFQVQYMFESPALWTPAPVQLTFQMESEPENFVFSGCRKRQQVMILHEPGAGPYALAAFTLIPVGNTGLVSLPRFRCWQLLETPMQHHQRIQALEHEYMDPETGQSQLSEEETRIRMKELKVVEVSQEIGPTTAEEEDVAPLAQSPLRMLILPR